MPLLKHVKHIKLIKTVADFPLTGDETLIYYSEFQRRVSGYVKVKIDQSLQNECNAREKFCIHCSYANGPVILVPVPYDLCLETDNAAAHKCALIQDLLEKAVHLPHPSYPTLVHATVSFGTSL